jgi:hypothetical protein
MSRQSAMRVTRPGPFDGVSHEWQRGLKPFEDIDVTFTAATSATANHRLGRRYSHAFVLGQHTTSGTARSVIVGTPEATDANGGDASKNIYLSTHAAGAWTGTVRVRVYAS